MCGDEGVDKIGCQTCYSSTFDEKHLVVETDMLTITIQVRRRKKFRIMLQGYVCDTKRSLWSTAGAQFQLKN